MISLRNSQVLDDILTSIFQHENSIILGFGFENDFKEFSKSLPKMNFWKMIPNFFDLQKFYGGNGLKKVCEDQLKLTLNKNEKITLSNWENRPLSDVQIQNAALFSWILIKIMDQTMRKGRKLEKVK